MSISIHGIGLGGGITIGNAYILDKNLDDATVHKLEKHEIKAEVLRFTDAVNQTRREFELLKTNIPKTAPSELGSFLSLSIMMLSDSKI